MAKMYFLFTLCVGFGWVSGLTSPYIPDVCALLWLLLDRKHRQTSRSSFFSLKRRKSLKKIFILGSEQEEFKSTGIDLILKKQHFSFSVVSSLLGYSQTVGNCTIQMTV